MSKTPTYDRWEMDDQALLQAIALSLSPRLHTAATAPAEPDTTPGAGFIFSCRPTGRTYRDDV